MHHIKIHTLIILLYYSRHVIYGIRRVILVRHGESLWNKYHRYTGWANIPLTEQGKYEAKNAGMQLKLHGITPTISFSSTLERSVETNTIIFDEMGSDIPVYKEWRLNERHYGKLTGHDRNTIPWVGGYFDLPPTNVESGMNVSNVSPRTYDPIFGESYYMTLLRIRPFLQEVNELMRKEEVPMLCSHRNTLRVIIKEIEHLSNEKVPYIDVPNATPIIYDFDDNMNVVRKFILE